MVLVKFFVRVVRMTKGMTCEYWKNLVLCALSAQKKDKVQYVYKDSMYNEEKRREIDILCVCGGCQ